MAYDSGTVTTFDGTTGLVQTLVAWLKGTVVVDEVADSTPDGTLTSFSGTLASTSISPGQLTFKYTIGGNTYTANVSGAGVVTGTEITSGTVTYSTGAWVIVFATPPDDTTDILADYIYGAAGQDWKVELERKTRDSSNVEIWPSGTPKEYILSNTLDSGDGKIYIGLREWENVGEGAYGVDLNVYMQYIRGEEWNSNIGEHGQTDYDSTWEHYSKHPTIMLADDTMSYWIYASKQRVVIVVKVANHYVSAYLGFGRRFGPPSSYPYPLLCIGSSHGNMIQSDISLNHQYILSPPKSDETDKYYNAWIYSPGNAFKITDDCYFLPAHDFNRMLGALDKTSNSKVLMTPCFVVNDIECETYMDLDRVYHVACLNIQSEDRLNIGGTYYRVFQNIFRSDYYDYMAIKEE